MSDSNEQRPIIKKVIKVEGGGHHGGAWKVAYADFTTAMMAFFMLLWLLNVAPPETLMGLADYFSPTTAATSGTSGIEELNPPTEDGRGLNASPIVVISNPGTPQDNAGPSQGRDSGADADQQFEPGGNINDALAERIRAQEDNDFNVTQEELRIAIQASPTLVQHSDQVIMEITEDGMKIQLIDRDRRPMFQPGTATLFDFARELIAEIGEAVQSLPNRISVQGHTDSGSFRRPDGYNNWDLSSERANAARRVLDSSGISSDRIFEVVGKASSDPLYPDTPGRSENRRITVLVLREAPVVPPGIASDR